MRLSWQKATSEIAEKVMEVPDYAKGLNVIEIQSLQLLPDGSVGYQPPVEPRIYTLSDGNVELRYYLDFNGLWPDEDEMRAKWIGYDWAPKRRYFPIQGMRFHESNRYLIVKFRHNSDLFLHVFDKIKNKNTTVKLDSEIYMGSSFVSDSQIFLWRNDNSLEIMSIDQPL